MNTASKILLVLLPVLGGCASTVPAPVEDRAAAQATVPTTPVATGTAAESRGMYTVKKGDTLYSIALDNGQDYKDIAAWNNIEDPNRISIGQQLRVTLPNGGAPVAVAKPVVSSAPIEVKAAPAPKVTSNTENLKRQPKGGKLAYSDEALTRARQAEEAAKPVEQKPAETKSASVAEKSAEKLVENVSTSDGDIKWSWPSSGQLLARFTERTSGQEANKGIDIDGNIGDSVVAAAAGRVIYVGQFSKYGNLVVLTHGGGFSSIYAHNQRILVKEGQHVTRGQKIAELGDSDADQAKLHFEIRRQGKPADPQKFLPPR